MIDAESNAAAYEFTAKRLARFEREGFVLGGVIAAALRKGIEEERDGERLGDEESEPAGAERVDARGEVSARERGSPNTRKSPAAARGSARLDRAEDEEDEKTNGRHSNDVKFGRGFAGARAVGRGVRATTRRA